MKINVFNRKAGKILLCQILGSVLLCLLFELNVKDRTEYHENGKISKTKTNKLFTAESEISTFYDNGKLKSKIVFNENMNSFQESYTNIGLLEYTYKRRNSDGYGVRKYYDEDGFLRSKEEYLGKRKNGETTSYTKEGKVIKTSLYVSDQKVLEKAFYKSVTNLDSFNTTYFPMIEFNQNKKQIEIGDTIGVRFSFPIDSMYFDNQLFVHYDFTDSIDNLNEPNFIDTLMLENNHEFQYFIKSQGQKSYVYAYLRINNKKYDAVYQQF